MPPPPSRWSAKTFARVRRGSFRQGAALGQEGGRVSVLVSCSINSNNSYYFHGNNSYSINGNNSHYINSNNTLGRVVAGWCAPTRPRVSALSRAGRVGAASIIYHYNYYAYHYYCYYLSSSSLLSVL